MMKVKRANGKTDSTKPEGNAQFVLVPVQDYERLNLWAAAGTKNPARSPQPLAEKNEMRGVKNPTRII
jgi:hypothetical protein